MSDDISSKVILDLFVPQTLTANANGPAVSLAGFQGMVDVIAHGGAPGNATGTISFQLQTSADGATNWQNVGPVLAAFTTTSGIVAANLNPVGCLAFLRCVATLGGTSPSFSVCVLAIGAPQYKS
jgi:hypothetical protein